MLGPQWGEGDAWPLKSVVKQHLAVKVEIEEDPSLTKGPSLSALKALRLEMGEPRGRHCPEPPAWIATATREARFCSL